MPKGRSWLPTGRSFTHNVLANIMASLVLSAGAIVLAAIALWVKNIPDVGRGVLFGLALAMLIFAVVVIYFWARWRKTSKSWSTGVFSNGPRIVFGEKKFYTEEISFKDRHDPPLFYLEADALRLNFRNASEDQDAIRLQIKFTCVGRGVRLRWIDARLDSFKQPPELLPGESPQVIFDLEAKGERGATFITKEPQSDKCYLFNNSSYNYPPRMQNPAWELRPGKYKLLVEVLGLAVVRRFECTFVNPGVGSLLVIKSYRVVDLFD